MKGGTAKGGEDCRERTNLLRRGYQRQDGYEGSESFESCGEERWNGKRGCWWGGIELKMVTYMCCQ